MRLLKFNVDAQKLSKDPTCDFNNLVAGTRKYLRAYFTFSPEWDDCVKVVSFWRGNKEHAVILQNDECEIDPEALVGTTFGVTVTGQRGEYRITTDKVTVRQRGRLNNGNS